MTTRQGGGREPESASVIYSFKSRWADDIETGRIGVFFRKRGPASKPSRVFIYLGSPISAVVAVADVDRMEDVDLARSVELTKLGRITEDELKRYIGPHGAAKAIFLKNHKRLKRPLPVNELRRIFNFHPPQNFMQVSKEVERKIMEAANEKEAN